MSTETILENPQQHTGRARKDAEDKINPWMDIYMYVYIYIYMVIYLLAFHERKLLYTRFCPDNRLRKPAKQTSTSYFPRS